MGWMRQVVQWIAIHGSPESRWTIGKAATTLGVSTAAASRVLHDGLALLVAHYAPPKAARAVAVSRMVDLEVTDIPQERLGRVA